MASFYLASGKPPGRPDAGHAPKKALPAPADGDGKPQARKPAARSKSKPPRGKTKTTGRKRQLDARPQTE